MTELKLRSAPRDADIVFLGDSITDRWRFRPELWAKLGNPANLGIGGSRTANLLWLVESGKLAEFHPKLLVVRIGANDLSGNRGFFDRRKPTREQVESGVDLIRASLHRQFPEATILVMPPPQTDELASDGIHLNDLGYEHWAESVRYLRATAAPM